MARHFAHWLKTYCQFTQHSEAPLDFHFWTGVSTIASVLRRRVWKDELLFKWTPNFYIVFVGPAGIVTKSTTLGLGLNLLRRVAGVHFGPDSMTWHGLGKDFETAFEYVDFTDAQGKKRPIPMSALTCSVSELGTFLRPDDKALVSFLTDVWDGKERPFRHTTKSSGEIKIENPWLNIIAATTPSWLQENFPVSLLSEGIGSRIVFVYNETKRHFTAYPSRQIRAVDYSALETQLVEDLTHISKLVGPFELTDAAYTWGESWYIKHQTTSSTTMASGRFGGYLARKQTHMHKLAMILSAAQRDDLLIQESDLKEAEAILSSAESSMIRVFESVGVVDEAKHVAELVAFVRAHKWLTAKQLYRLCYNIMAEKDFKMALRHAIEGDLLYVTAQNGMNGISIKPKVLHS